MSPALYGFDRRIAITAWTQGPWGPYLPFMHPSKPGRPIHAEDTFDTHGLGYRFDGPRHSAAAACWRGRRRGRCITAA